MSAGEAELLADYRILPTEAIREELTRRGVILWHHGLEQ